MAGPGEGRWVRASDGNPAWQLPNGRLYRKGPGGKVAPVAGITAVALLNSPTGSGSPSQGAAPSGRGALVQCSDGRLAYQFPDGRLVRRDASGKVVEVRRVTVMGALNRDGSTSQVPYGDMSGGSGFGTGPGVTIVFPGPAPQRRLTVAFRLILAIPLLIVSVLVAAVALLSIIFGWFGALILGRLPRWTAKVLAYNLRYQTRVNCYVLLMTDVYPPLRSSDSRFPIKFDVQTTKLNRWSVLFRLILQVPAYFVTHLAVLGLNLAAVVIWLVVLIVGRMPDAIYRAVAGVLLYLARYAAFFGMLTSTYPSGILGERAPLDRRSTVPLTLPAASKAIVWVFISLGVICELASGIPAFLGAYTSSLDRTDLILNYNAIDAKFTQIAQDEAACSSQQDQLACLQQSVATGPTTVQSFVTSMRTFDLPSKDQAAETNVESDANALISTMAEMANASSLSQYESLAKQLVPQGSQLDADFSTLLQQIGH